MGFATPWSGSTEVSDYLGASIQACAAAHVDSLIRARLSGTDEAPWLGTAVIPLDASGQAWTWTFLTESVQALLGFDDRIESALLELTDRLSLSPIFLETGRITAQSMVVRSSGTSIGLDSCATGTLSGILSLGDRTWGLTAGHVLAHDGAPAATGTEVMGADGSVVGTVHAVTRLRRYRANTVDLVACEDPAGHLIERCVEETDLGRANVTKVGAASGTTHGEIAAVSARVAMWVQGRRLRFMGLIGVATEDASAFSVPGDSGAVVVTGDSGQDAVGMVIGAQPTGSRAGGPISWMVPAMTFLAAAAELADQ